jgi:hypothetical protein
MLLCLERGNCLPFQVSIKLTYNTDIHCKLRILHNGKQEASFGAENYEGE